MNEEPVPNDDEEESENSIEEIFIEEDSDEDDSSNVASNRISNPLNISTEVNVESDVASTENSLVRVLPDETVVNSTNGNDSLQEEPSADESAHAQEITDENSAVIIETQAISFDSAHDKTNEHQAEQNADRSSLWKSTSDNSALDSSPIKEQAMLTARDNGKSNEQLAEQNQNSSLENLSFVSLNMVSVDDGQSDEMSNDTSDREVKPNVVPMYELHRANNADILNQLEDWVIDYEDDEMQIVVSSKGYGAPLGTTLDGLVKPEKPDEFSGMMPFYETVILHHCVLILQVFFIENIFYYEIENGPCVQNW